MERLVRLKILAASVALQEFTVQELIAYSGANEHTVRSILSRDKRFFEPVFGKASGETARRPGSEMGADQPGSPARGRPPTKWRVVESEQIQRLVAGLHDQLSEAQQDATRLTQQTAEGAYIARVAAVKVAEDSVLRAGEEHDPELQRVLCRTAFNTLVNASPTPAGSEVTSKGFWWDASPAEGPASLGVDQEDSLRRRAQAIATLTRVIDAQAVGSIVGTDEVTAAMVAVGKLDVTLSDARVWTLIERLMDSAMRTRTTVGKANVLARVVRAKSPVPVDDLFSGTGLPQREVDREVQRLVDLKYVVPYYDKDAPERKRPVSALQVNQEEYRAIGISILPDEVVGALTSLQATESKSAPVHRKFGIGRQGQVDVDIVIRAISSLVTEFKRGRPNIIGLGVELPGHVGRMGEVVYSPILQQRNIQLEDGIEAATGLRTIVQNDANALAVHEQYFGDGVDTADFAVILLPERGGVGSGLVSNSRIVYGRRGAAGELGHIEFKPGGAPCDCGKSGCLETVAGVAGILREIHEISPAVVTLSAAAKFAEKSRAAQDVFTDAGKALGWGISAILNLIDPERVILFAPEELVNQDYPAADCFTRAVEETARTDAFSTTAQFKHVFRPLICKPVWRPLPKEGGITASAASAILGHFIPRAHDWDPTHLSKTSTDLAAAGSAG